MSDILSPHHPAVESKDWRIGYRFASGQRELVAPERSDEANAGIFTGVGSSVPRLH